MILHYYELFVKVAYNILKYTRIIEYVSINTKLNVKKHALAINDKCVLITANINKLKINNNAFFYIYISN